MRQFRFSLVDFVFTCAGLLCLVADVGLDVVAAVTFYQDRDFVSLGLLLLFLVGSSVLVQLYSWLWFSDTDCEKTTAVEKCLTHRQLTILHVFQLGIYVRHAGVVEMSLRSIFGRKADTRPDTEGGTSLDGYDRSGAARADEGDTEGIAVFLSHDLSMLRLIETFSEGAPQFVLMLTLLLRRGQLEPVTVLKAVGSASAIACSVTMYHRSLRSFLPDKEKQLMVSSVIYFTWNLFLISSRLTALALFASVLPCFVFAHFVCSWLLLFFFAWRSKTDFMGSGGGEWLYRATVGLIWYFDWFNVVEGRTRSRTLLYHGFILADVSLLCGLWYWRMSTDPPYLKPQRLYVLTAAVSVVGFYVLGLYFKIIYYKCYHPNLAKRQSEAAADGPPTALERTLGPASCGPSDEPDGLFLSRAPDVQRCNKRMRKLAMNFYT